MNKNQILKQRSITGIVFGAIVLTMLLAGKFTAIALFSIIALVCTYEYIRMVYPNDDLKRNISLLSTIGSILLLLAIDPSSDYYIGITLISCMAMIGGILNLFFPFIDHRKWYLLIVVFYFGLPLGLFISYTMHNALYPKYLCITLISLIWVSDSFAYLFGSRIGKNKMFERISPKKTWEGFIGGGICTLIAGYIISLYYTDLPLSFWIFASTVTAIIGTLGDLVESSVKRTFDIKDSGTILPGHGGLLDRFDSFIYILPFILLLLLNSKNG